MLRQLSPMTRMQPVNFQRNNQNFPTTTNPVPASYRQRVQPAIVNDFLHPSKYLALYVNRKSPEIESQDCLISRRQNLTLEYPFLLHTFQSVSMDSAALQI